MFHIYCYSVTIKWKKPYYYPLQPGFGLQKYDKNVKHRYSIHQTSQWLSRSKQCVFKFSENVFNCRFYSVLFCFEPGLLEPEPGLKLCLFSGVFTISFDFGDSKLVAYLDFSLAVLVSYFDSVLVFTSFRKANALRKLYRLKN